MRVAGFVLAGGQSSRMRRDKALLPFAGSTLIASVARQVLEAAGNVAVVGHPGEYAKLGFPTLDEDFSGCGPLSGIEAALRQMAADWALITACDMPGISSAWLRRLIVCASASNCSAVVTLSTAGRPEPLLAIYHANLHSDVRKALTDGNFSVRDLIAGWSVEYAEAPSADTSINVNTPEEWAAWTR